MAGILVDVQLKVLVIEQNATAGLEDRDMVVILLWEHVVIVTLRQGSLDFNHLTLELRPTHGIRVTPMTLKASKPTSLYSQVPGKTEENGREIRSVGYLLTTFSKSGLHFGTTGLKVVVDHRKVLKSNRENVNWWERTPDQEFDFLGIRLESIPCINPQLLADTLERRELGIKKKHFQPISGGGLCWLIISELLESSDRLWFRNP